MGELRYTLTAWDEGDCLVVRVIRWDAGKRYPGRVPLHTFERVGRSREEIGEACIMALQRAAGIELRGR